MEFSSPFPPQTALDFNHYLDIFQYMFLLDIIFSKKKRENLQLDIKSETLDMTLVNSSGSWPSRVIINSFIRFSLNSSNQLHPSS